MGNVCFREEPIYNDTLKYEDNDDFSHATAISVADRKSKNYVHLTDFKRIILLGKGAYGKVLLVEYQKGDKKKFYAMKIIEKKNITRESQVRHLKDERFILERVNSEFVVKLRFAFQNNHRLYFIVDYMAGGEFFFHIKSKTILSEHFIKFYTAEILFGLEHLHALKIIYRDLKPENILLTESGHLKLSDFGLSIILKEQKDRAFTQCGTPDYLAPEILSSISGYTFTCDYYSLGCLVYQMFFGTPPFYSKDKKEMYKLRMTHEVPFLNQCSKEASELLSGLLQIHPDRRLGKNGAREVLNCKFFQDLDLEGMRKLQIPPPLNNIEQFKFFDPRVLHERIAQSPNDVDKITYFEGFTYQQKLSQS